jgi:hypothetical protein
VPKSKQKGYEEGMRRTTDSYAVGMLEEYSLKRCRASSKKKLKGERKSRLNETRPKAGRRMVGFSCKAALRCKPAAKRNFGNAPEIIGSRTTSTSFVLHHTAAFREQQQQLVDSQ